MAVQRLWGEPEMMPQSPTSLQTFLTCPRQYEAKYITREVKFQDTDHTRFGTLLHAAIENYLKHGEPLPSILLPAMGTLARMRNIFLGAEVKLAVDFNGAPVDWGAKTAYQRCIVDAMLISRDQKTIICVDWKTGKKRDASMQHDFIKHCVAAHYPQVEKILTIFVYLFSGESDRQEYQPGGHLTQMKINMGLLSDAHLHNQFLPKPSGLCKNWCDVISCEFNGRKNDARETTA